jgi:hypothetical protein
MQNKPQNPENPQAPSLAPAPVSALAPVEVPAGAPQEPPLPLGLSKRQLILAFAIAGVSDVISVFTTWTPPVEWVVDFSTAVLLFVVLGWRWLLLPGLIMEAIPGVGVVPVWVLVVAAIAIWGSTKPKVN